MTSTRRGFLGYLLGSGAGLATGSACQIVPATPEDVKRVETGGVDFACLPLDRLFADVRVSWEVEPYLPESMRYAVNVNFRTWDYETCQAIERFFHCRQYLPRRSTGIVGLS